MRGSSASRNNQLHNKQGKIARESEQIMKRIAQIKEGMSPQMTSNMKFGSQHRQKWQRYLPMENNNNIHSFASVSHHQKQDQKLDHYRQSLESRLEKLFREEKELLKERHLMSSYGVSQGRSRDAPPKVLNPSKADMSNSIDRMDRKIKLLEERYQQQGQKDQRHLKYQKDQKDRKYQKQGRPGQAKQNDFNATTTKTENQMMAQEKHEIGSPARDQGNGRGRVRSEVLVQQEAQQSRREHRLEHQMQELRTNIVEIKQSNKELTRRMLQKEEKSKYKQRTKEILQNILHKLEFINVQLSSAKTRAKAMNAGVGGGDLGDSRQAGRMQQQAEELMAQFQTLKVQYRHLDEKRRKVERRQSEIESKLGDLVPK